MFGNFWYCTGTLFIDLPLMSKSRSKFPRELLKTEGFSQYFIFLIEEEYLKAQGPVLAQKLPFKVI